MFYVCLYNDTVINVMTLSLAEKDGNSKFCGNFDASIPNYTASHSGDRAQDYQPLHGGDQTPRVVSCARSWDHIAVHQALVLCPFVLRPFALTPRTALHRLFTPSHFLCNALGLVYLRLFDPFFLIGISFFDVRPSFFTPTFS
jgi:hypothetical protein